MVKGFSRAILMGNLTRDPETRSTQTGRSVTSFAVAVNRSYKSNAGNAVDDVSYFECEAWGPVGETIAKWCHRGTGILVSGRLRQENWEDKAGNKRTTTRLTVDDFNFVGGGNGGEGGASYGGSPYGGSSYGGGSYGGGAGGKKSGGSAAGKADAGAPVADVLPEEIEVNSNEEINLEEMPF